MGFGFYFCCLELGDWIRVSFVREWDIFSSEKVTDLNLCGHNVQWKFLILAKDSWSLTLIPSSSNADALGPSQPQSETQQSTTFLLFLLFIHQLINQQIISALLQCTVMLCMENSDTEEIFTAVIFTALVKYCKMPQNGSSAPGTSKLNRSHHHHLDKLEMNGGKSMLCWWLKIAFHVSRSICHLGLFQGGGISISSHLQVIVTVEQFAECVCVLWRCGTSQGLYTYG